MKSFLVDILKQIEKEKKVLPKPEVNKIIQNRKLEKSFVNKLGISTTEWACHPIKFLGGGDGFDPIKKEVKAKK